MDYQRHRTITDRSLPWVCGFQDKSLAWGEIFSLWPSAPQHQSQLHNNILNFSATTVKTGLQAKQIQLAICMMKNCKSYYAILIMNLICFVHSVHDKALIPNYRHKVVTVCITSASGVYYCIYVKGSGVVATDTI